MAVEAPVAMPVRKVVPNIFIAVVTFGSTAVKAFLVAVTLPVSTGVVGYMIEVAVLVCLSACSFVTATLVAVTMPVCLGDVGFLFAVASFWFLVVPAMVFAFGASIFSTAYGATCGLTLLQ